jgi:hypothetical protein
MSDVKKGSASFKLDWVDVWGVAKAVMAHLSCQSSQLVLTQQSSG